MVKILQQTDDVVDQIAAALAEFEKSHESSECAVYRYNPASIRVKIVDAVFQGRSKGERHDYAMRFLRHLPEDVLAQISILLCLAPGDSSLLDLEFHDPTRSRL
jgi:stress-induced morphogen